MSFLDNNMALQRWWIDGLLVVCLVAVLLAVRLPIVLDRKIMPAGDAFNFQYITSHLLKFDYPHHEKRLPVYSLFLLPERLLGLDPIRTSITVSLLSSAGILVGLYMLGRTFGFARWAVVAMVGLSIFDPLLTINSVRPLSDSMFVMWVVFSILGVTRLLVAQERPSRNTLLGVGVLLALMMFTRYEGFPLAALLIPCVWLKWRFKDILWLALVPLVVSILWIPMYLYIQGSWTGLEYITDGSDNKGSFGEVNKIPENFEKLMNGSGWQRIWGTPRSELSEAPVKTAALRVLSNWAWWVSIMALLGLPWIVITKGKAAWPILVAGAGYIILLSWWWVYSRYVAPVSAIFYVLAAGGLSSLLVWLRRLYAIQRWEKLSLILLVGLGLATVYGLWQQAPPFYASALSRTWENNRKGYALYRAFKDVASHHERVGLAAESPMAVFEFGWVDQPKTEALGLYVTDVPGSSADDVYARWKDHYVVYIVDTGSNPILSDVVTRLDREGHIVSTQRYENIVWDTWTPEVALVYEVKW